jgi:hypothetical protein
VISAARESARADEGGVSFWLPGQYGSFAAEAPTPGWSLSASWYVMSADASASKEFARGGSVRGGIDSHGNFLYVFPTYALRDTIAGGTLAFNLGWAFGALHVESDATLTGPGGGVVTRHPSDDATGGSDLYPQVSLHWVRGSHYSMAYVLGNVPVGAYDPERLASLGLGHAALDVGGAYTYFDEQKGHEASATLGVTYNFENHDTHYRNGLDSHLDWGASQFLNDAIHAGIAGYFYYQLTGDSGDGAVLGDFKSQVMGLGPQAGWFFVQRGHEWYVNLKSYWEFAEHHRPAGWNMYLSANIPLGGSKP